MSDALPTEFLIDAQRRVAEREGVVMTVVRRGYGSVGELLLKVNLLNGTARVLTRMRYDDALVWSPVSAIDPMPEKDADAYLSRSAERDPDVWVIEIEDKQGRHWFPGKIIS